MPEAQAQEVKKVARLPRKLKGNRLQETHYEYTNWVADADAGDTVEDAMEPSYWANVAERMRPWDHIFLRADDGSWYAELLVLACDRQWAHVHRMRYEVLSEPQEVKNNESAFEVVWRGPHRKWGIKRVSDGAVIKEDYQTKNLAFEAMMEYGKALT